MAASTACMTMSSTSPARSGLACCGAAAIPALLSPEVAVSPSIITTVAIISGAALRRTLLFTGVHVRSYARLDGAVILPRAEIGRGAQLRNVIVDRGVKIPPGLVVGDDMQEDARRFRRTERGVCLITQKMIDRLGS